MKALNNIRNFLYSKDYFINFFEDYIHVFNFTKLSSISNELVSFEFISFRILIKGNDFVVKRMLKNEILIQGRIKSVEYER